MDITQLHQILHPKRSPIDVVSSYQHKISNDMSVCIERKSKSKWVVSLYERGHLELSETYSSEGAACERFLKLAI